MKDRTLLLAGLVDEDDLEKTRNMVVEDYIDQLKADRKIVSEQVRFIEEDEQRFGRLIGIEEPEPEWEGSKKLEESGGIAMGGYGPGFAGQKSYGLGIGGGGISSRYTPNTDDIYGAIIGKDYGKSPWGEVQNSKVEIFRKIGETNPYAFDGGSALSEAELPEFDENFNPILGENEKAPSLFNFDMSTNNQYAELQEKLNSGEFAAQGGIGPGFSAYDGPKEIKNPYEGHSALTRWYMNENEELDEDIQDHTQTDLADLDIDSLQIQQGTAGEMPQEINLTNANLTLVGEQSGQYIYTLDDDDSRVGVSQDIEGWYAQVRDAIIGLAGEGYGATPEEAVEEALGSFSGTEPEVPSTLSQPSLNESFASLSIENNDQNRRTGTPDDGLHIRYTQGNPTMYPDAPEEPSSKGHPGLPGWDFYDGDHTKQRLDSKMDDVLDEGEPSEAVDVLLKILGKNSIFKESPEEVDDVLEEAEEYVDSFEKSSGMSTSFSIE